MQVTVRQNYFQIAKSLRLISIRQRPDTFESDRCIIEVDPSTFVMYQSVCKITNRLSSRRFGVIVGGVRVQSCCGLAKFLWRFYIIFCCQHTTVHIPQFLRFNSQNLTMANAWYFSDLHYCSHPPRVPASHSQLRTTVNLLAILLCAGSTHLHVSSVTGQLMHRKPWVIMMPTSSSLVALGL